VTGQPCPTCGSTRASLALVRADVLLAWKLNPLYTIVAVAAVPFLLLHYAFGLRIQLAVTPQRRRLLWIALILAVLANWVYLCLAGV
jgi:hypothetical protein